MKDLRLTKSDPPIPMLTTSSIGFPVYPTHFFDIIFIIKKIYLRFEIFKIFMVQVLLVQ